MKEVFEFSVCTISVLNLCGIVRGMKYILIVHIYACSGCAYFAICKHPWRILLTSGPMPLSKIILVKIFFILYISCFKHKLRQTQPQSEANFCVLLCCLKNNILEHDSEIDISTYLSRST